MLNKPVFTVFFLLTCGIAYCQDSASLYDKGLKFTDRVFNKVEKKSKNLQKKMDQSMHSYLERLCRQEMRMKQHLARKDSAAAEQTFGGIRKKYDELEGIRNAEAGQLQNVYNGHLDSMVTAITFLQQTKTSVEAKEKMEAMIKQYSGIQEKLNQSDWIQQQAASREAVLKNKLQNLGEVQEFKKYRETAYYYRTKIEEYRNVLSNPEKMESTLLTMASRFSGFQKFFARYSQLGRLFRLPALEEENAAGVTGLQTRSLIMQETQQQLGSMSNEQQAMSANMNSAQSSIRTLKDRITQSGSGGDIGMPDFKPNSQKMKSFLRRIELGTNVQSTKSGFFFPTTTDLGLSIGYRFTSKAIAGVGASYKIGWGDNIRHIMITHQGIGLRSFTDIKLKGSIWISGGTELNYRATFKDFAQLRNAPGWQKSALLGLTKKYQLNKKVKANLQLLYDFLYNRQLPAGQPLVFRTGYNFK